LGAAPRIYYRRGDFTGGRRSQPDDESDEDLCRNWWKVIKKDVVEFNQGWLHNLRNVITSVIEHNRFFLTHRGFMGIGGSGISTGDRVFVLRGDQPPFILHHVGEEKHGREGCHHPCFQLVGTSYLHGIMDGEVLKK
jgi:hypothetical protein